MVEHHSHLLSFHRKFSCGNPWDPQIWINLVHYITLHYHVSFSPWAPWVSRMVQICWDSHRFPDRLRFWGQMEVPLGIIPGGGACVNLRRVLGAARAMEVSGPASGFVGHGYLDMSWDFNDFSWIWMWFIVDPMNVVNRPPFFIEIYHESPDINCFRHVFWMPIAGLFLGLPW